MRDTHFHSRDGARYLRHEGWPESVCDLVAHHSGSRFVARIRGLADELSQFVFVEDALSDALTTADDTTGPTGTVMTLDDRPRRCEPSRPRLAALGQHDFALHNSDASLRGRSTSE